MKEKIRKKPLYACNICCSHLSALAEPCHRCHRGKGEQVYPIIKKTSEEIKEIKKIKAMYFGIARLHKRPRPIDDDKRRKDNI